MNNTLKIFFAALVAFSIWGCGTTTENKPAANNANAGNTNSAKPTAAAPTKEALFELDKKANEAYLKGDTKYFEGMLSDKFVSYDMGQRMDKAGMLKMMGEWKCDVKTWSLEDPQMAPIDADTYVVSYKGNFDGTCAGPDGKSMKMPSPMRAASVWVRNGDKWNGVYHGEVPIIDPKNPPKPSSTQPADKKAAPKKEDKSAANAAESKPAAPAADAATTAMLAVEKSGWEAWKARDAKKLEDVTTKDLSFLNLMGMYMATKADVIKSWTEGKCDIKSVNVTDGTGTMLSPTLGVLTFKGTADGTCDGNKIMPLYGTSFYVKDGDTWKLAFGFESPA